MRRARRLGRDRARSLVQSIGDAAVRGGQGVGAVRQRAESAARGSRAGRELRRTPGELRGAVGHAARARRQRVHATREVGRARRELTGPRGSLVAPVGEFARAAGRLAELVVQSREAEQHVLEIRLGHFAAEDGGGGLGDLRGDRVVHDAAVGGGAHLD
ncbi:MAG: hypothetical protein K0Q58_294, partial [Microbacterium sp.]|nr:hypothetical protein [Microbacterium sp.]